MIRGKFYADDDLDLAFNRILNWRWIQDIPTNEGSPGNALLVGPDGVAVWGEVSSTCCTGTFPPDPHTHPWDEVTGKPTFVNLISAGTNIQISTSVSNVTVAVVDDPTFAGTLTANTLRSNGDVYINYDGLDGDSYLYFYESASPSGRYIKWDDSDNQFQMNDDLNLGIYGIQGNRVELQRSIGSVPYITFKTTSGTAKARIDTDGDAILNIKGSTNGSAFNQIMSFDTSNLRVGVRTTAPSVELDVVGQVSISSTLNGVNATFTDDVSIGGDCFVDGDLYINQDNNITTSIVYFGNGAYNNFIRVVDSFGNWAMRFQNLGVFEFTGGALWTEAGAIYVRGLASTDGDGWIYFRDNANASGQYFKWDNGDSRFETSTSLHVTGDIDATVGYKVNGSTLAITHIGGSGATSGQIAVWNSTAGQWQPQDKDDCPVYKRIIATGLTEGDIHLSDATNWATSKALIKTIRVETLSNRWNLYLLQNDNGLITDDASIGAMQLMERGRGDMIISLDYAYEDEDASDEVHLYWDDEAGTATVDLTIIGYGLK
ncbi:MAG: hypothetical protein AMJ55_00400 [Gammaproteobacteria bacterium SG8_15]|nr:MAG: hypothetical protein AMJ55_00400 [Gammaproteobacteria bacterium SG8_15]